MRKGVAMGVAMGVGGYNMYEPSRVGGNRGKLEKGPRLIKKKALTGNCIRAWKLSYGIP